MAIKFKNSYVNNSAGFHKYTDPKDNEVYVFTHLEPYFCHRWFPCFDQPSLRASVRLIVISPEPQWQVVGNAKKALVYALKEAEAIRILKELDSVSFIDYLSDSINAVLHTFEETPFISTYIFGLFAGHFQVFKDESVDS